MSVTIQEVAEAAGVSKATVSKVLHKSYSISQETCDRVNAVIKELGYQPYVITLAEGHSFVMINGRYYDNMYGALFDAASRPSYVAQYKIKF